MATLRCPRCGSEHVRRATAPIRLRDQLEAALSPLTILLGGVDRYRYGLACDECRLRKMVIRRGVLDRLVVHGLAGVLIGGIVFGIARSRWVHSATSNLDLSILLGVGSVVMYWLMIWVVHRLRTRAARR